MREETPGRCDITDGKITCFQGEWSIVTKAAEKSGKNREVTTGFGKTMGGVMFLLKWGGLILDG